MPFAYNSPPPFSPPPSGPDMPVSAPIAPPMPGGAGANGIPGAMGMPPAPYPVPQGPPDPSSMKYTTQTQQDGTVLLILQNPDGTPGPVVQVIKPPGMGGAKKGH